MKQKGTLIKWNDSRGFGFIKTEDGKEVFIHISEIANSEIRPELNEIFWFHIVIDSKGKEKAVDVTRPLSSQKIQVEESKPARIHTRKKRHGAFDWVISLILISAIIFTASRYFINSFPSTYLPNFAFKETPVSFSEVENTVTFSETTNTVTTRFSCDGRQHCAQMTSCAEATFFIQNCPNTKMDGDGDGIPCESQWCF
ncbi:MAG: hypothetical protein RL217_917 [Pseudomonadota bacterium]|jgi:cold shock CspA family protein